MPLDYFSTQPTDNANFFPTARRFVIAANVAHLTGWLLAFSGACIRLLLFLWGPLDWLGFAGSSIYAIGLAGDDLPRRPSSRKMNWGLAVMCLGFGPTLLGVCARYVDELYSLFRADAFVHFGPWVDIPDILLLGVGLLIIVQALLVGWINAFHRRFQQSLVKDRKPFSPGPPS